MSTARWWWVVTAILGVAVYAAAWIGWSTPWSWVVSVDDAALNATHAYGVEHPAWVVFWNALCTVFSPVAFRVVALGVIVWAAMRRQWRLALYLAVGVELPGLFTVVFKALSDRPRPDTALVWASSSSFPSGHAFGTTAAVLVLLALVWPRVRSRGLLLVACVAVVLLVGIGRVVLNVHHPSDVVAGWALGYAWFVVTLPLLPRFIREEAGIPAVRDS
jgi:membrane-associated phospholipid phosphatase